MWFSLVADLMQWLTFKRNQDLSLKQIEYKKINTMIAVKCKNNDFEHFIKVKCSIISHFSKLLRILTFKSK